MTPKLENQKTTPNHELLLPVGTIEMAKAAVNNGADAIYIGMPGFNARGRSADLSLETLSEIIQYCHLHGVKVNLAFNIVIFENELVEVIPLLEQVLALKPDAFIVQDLGLARLIREMAPTQVIHASTQMTITNYEAIQCLEDLNIKRFVLGRENSLEEIKLIRQNTEKELEVFVHGALCVAYSGQCFTSEGIGGRSANRGQCAQSCRFAYQMYVDGVPKNLIDRQYLVSPQDLCGLEQIPQLMEIGVNSFKIEGRLKTPDYVASCTQEYRSVMDSTLAHKNLTDDQFQNKKNQLAKVYSRGFFSGWLNGVNHQKLVDGTFSSHRGLYAGQVVRTSPKQLEVELESNIELTPGDGIRWVLRQKNKTIESGAQIFAIEKKGPRQFLLSFDNKIKFENDLTQAKIYFNHDHKLHSQIEKTIHDKNLRKRIPIQYKAQIKIGDPLVVEISDGYFVVRDQTESKLVLAQNKAFTDEMLNEELAALGGSEFIFGELTVQRHTDQNLFISHKEIKQLRQRLVSALEAKRSQSSIDHFTVSPKSTEQMNLWSSQLKGVKSAEGARLNVLLREKSQVMAVAQAFAAGKFKSELLNAVILDFEFGRDYFESVQLLKENKIKVGVATTRILKPQEYANLRAIEKMQPNLILVRNIGALHYFKNSKNWQGELIGDFSLNVTNHLTVGYLLEKGLSSVCTSYDLNQNQLSDLLESCDGKRLEVTVHQYMPSFHMEHCVFAAFMSQGSSYRDCGKPCEKHKVELQDQFGNRHLIKPDQECRNTMFNANPQTAAKYVQSWIKQGLGFVRYEALFEQDEELVTKIQMYLKLLSGDITSEQLVISLNLFEKYGLSEGQLAKTAEYVDRKKTKH